MFSLHACVLAAPVYPSFFSLSGRAWLLLSNCTRISSRSLRRGEPFLGLGREGVEHGKGCIGKKNAGRLHLQRTFIFRTPTTPSPSSSSRGTRRSISLRKRSIQNIITAASPGLRVCSFRTNTPYGVVDATALRCATSTEDHGPLGL